MSSKKLTKTDINLKKLIKTLKGIGRKEGSKLWRDIAERLSKPRRNQPKVNVYKLEKFTNNNETVVVPGKVLGVGNLSHKLTVSAFRFSELAKEKIADAKGKCISISDLANMNPKGSNVKIMS